MAKRRTRVNLGQPTKQDFVSLARILCKYGASTSMAEEMGTHFKQRNPRFDTKRFVTAAAGPRCRV